MCFHEKLLGENAETAKTTYTPASDARLLAFDTIPVPSGGSSTTATHDVLATFDNGDVICLSADIQVVRWVTSLKSSVPKLGSIEHISTATAKAVTRGLLRNREDIAAVLTSSANNASDLLELTQVLCVVGRKANGTSTLSLVAIQPRSPDLTTPQLSPLKHLVTWDLPSPTNAPKAPKEPPQFSLHASNGVVYILANNTLLSYDFTGTVPRLYSELVVPGTGVDSLLRLSQDLILIISRQTCRVFDTKYNTLQMTHSMDLISSTPDVTSPAKKRKLSQATAEDNLGSPYHMVAYHADQDLVVAVRESEIIGMHLGASFSRKRIKTEGILLSEALGKGVGTVAKDISLKWQERKAKLDRYASKGSINKFEETFASGLGVPLEAANSHTKQENEVTGGPLTNGIGPKIPDEDAIAIDFEDDNAEDELRSWKVPSVTNATRRQQSRQYASYALSKIFRPSKGTKSNDSQNILEIDFFAPNVFQWLLQTGNLSAASIRHAILAETPDSAQDLSLIADGDVVKAIVDFDPELHMLSAVLNDSGFLPIGEVVQAIRVLMQSLDEQAKQDNTNLLTNGTAPSEEEMDVDIASELAAASHEMDHAMSVLDHGLLIRSHTLRPALIRLHSFAPRLVTTTLRSMLSRRNLESLVNVLHLEMKNEGWSLPYDSSEIDLSNDTPDDHAVAIIASLLSCTLDAVGAAAWLASAGSPAGSEASEDTIYSLHSDTSEALIGFFEARYMRGLLSEFLGYASKVPKNPKQISNKLEMHRKPFTVSKDLSELPILPMGGKTDTIDKTKPGKGGKREERSKREIGMLISKKVPKYSFERIVI